MTDSAAVPEVMPEPDRDLHRALVRIVVGAIGEGIDRLLAVSTELDAVETSGDATPARVDPTLMAIVGWISEFPEFLAAAGDATARMTAPVRSLASGAWDLGASVARVVGVAPFVEGFTDSIAASYAAERDRLAAVGTAEYLRGRALAVYAFEESVDGIVALLSDSEELGELVREQTLGITGSAVQEIRETGAAADALTERVFRRLLNRPIRGLPPRPDGAP